MLATWFEAVRKYPGNVTSVRGHTHQHTHSDTGEEHQEDTARTERRSGWPASGPLRPRRAVATSRDRSGKQFTAPNEWFRPKGIFVTTTYEQKKIERQRTYAQSLLNRGGADKNQSSQLFLTLWVPL